MDLRLKVGAVALPLLLVGLTRAADTPKDKAAAKSALQQLNEFIGPWKGTGESKEGGSKIWKESMSWGWKFKDGDPSLAVEFKDSKQFDKGELRYLPAKKVFQLTVADKAGKERAFEGEFRRKYLTLSRVDPESKDRQIISMSTNNDGARLVYTYAVQTKGRGLEKKLFTVQHSKEGQSLASSKKNECVVTGGLGTMAVSYMGKTYYVCCSGCRDAFNENPKKIIDEYEKSKK